MKKKTLWFSSFYCLLFQFDNRKSIFLVLHSDINSFKSDLLHITGQPYCKKDRSSKVKYGIINLILRNYVVDPYIILKANIVLACRVTATQLIFFMMLCIIKLECYSTSVPSA
jgi:hypothetical protein